MFDGFPVTELLEHGLTGFAVVLLFLGFRLLSEFQKEMLKIQFRQFESLEIFNAWAGMARSLVANARIFMALSALFFIGGFAASMVSPKNNIIVSVAPPEGLRPVVTLHEDAVKLDDDGKVRLLVKNDHVIRVRNNQLIEAFNRKSKQLEDTENKLRKHIEQTLLKSDEAGF